ncbi:lysoplasmalogenase [Fulvivirgaceae bacterium BMA10]|uniref:Lysoplasmalogenase n=1 Tax=Splendidivirga corallicola TaxID=3051826 RepID=A0ABT8KTS6_9BACT|nr:lysoplasmalogenase [Fulvivirgaceae bacterium BMA10]
MDERELGRHLERAYFLVAILEVIAQLFDKQDLHSVVKPILMPILGSFFYVVTRRINDPITKLILLALTFSWLGDIFLMFQNDQELYFILGLIAFLIAHIFYIISYKKAVSSTLYGLKLSWLWYLIPVIFGISLYIYLYPGLEGMYLPVGLYALILIAMIILAIARFGKTKVESFQFVLIGAISFVLSDSILAINKFQISVPYAGVIIMVTYLLAQWLIIKGIQKHLMPDK